MERTPLVDEGGVAESGPQGDPEGMLRPGRNGSIGVEMYRYVCILGRLAAGIRVGSNVETDGWAAALRPE
jgi:hypothetical protein